MLWVRRTSFSGSLVAVLAIDGCQQAEPPAPGSGAPQPGDGSDGRPNILLILADDLGYTNVGLFGSEIRTPNLDELAMGGLRLANFHASPSCAPTRANRYLAFTAPHWPVMAPDDWIDRYTSRYEAGYDALREERFAQAKRLGILPDTLDLDDWSGTAPPWNELDNTVIVFSSDNGADGAQRTFQPLWVPRTDTDSSYGNIGRAESWFPVGRGWGETAMAPYRGPARACCTGAGRSCRPSSTTPTWRTRAASTAPI